MIESINKFEKILQTFRFKQPVPYDIQKLILKFKKDTVIKVLKNFGEYNAFYGTVLRFHFFTKRIGLNITARQSEIICIIIPCVTAAISLAGIIYFTVFLDSRNTNTAVLPFKDIRIRSEEKKTEKPAQRRTVPVQEKKKESFTGISIVMKQISSENENGELASGITDKLYYNLKKNHTDKRIIYRKFDGIHKSANRLLQGRLNKLGSTYLLSISIANAESGKIIFDKNYSFKRPDEIDDVVNQISTNIDNVKDLQQ